MTSFMISVIESWDTPNGPKTHRNDICVEVLGKEAESVYENLSPGSWVHVDGYLRSEQFRGQTVTRVRVFKISYEGDDSNEAIDEGTGEGGIRFNEKKKPS